MADERIDIIIQDKVDSTIETKLTGIANASNNADSALSRLKASLAAIGSGGLANLQQQLSLAASATSALAAAQNQLSGSNQTLAGNINKTATAQQTLNSANAAALQSQQNLNNAVNQGGNAQNQMGQSVNRTTGYLERMMIRMVAMLAIYEAFRAIKDLSSMGLDYNKTIESSRIGIAALLSAEGEFIDIEGKRVTGIEKVNAALAVSDEMINKLKKDNLATAATFEQLLKGFQTALAPGLQVGFNPDQIEKYSVSMVKAATAMRMPLDQLAEEMRSMLTGNISARNTIIATRLGITPDQIKKLQGDSEALFSFIMNKLKAFDDFGPLVQNSFEGLFSNLKDKLSEALGIGTEPFFKELKAYFEELYNSIVEVDKVTGEVNLKPEFLARVSVLNGLLSETLGIVKAIGKAFDAGLGLYISLDKAIGGGKANDWTKSYEDAMDKYLTSKANMVQTGSIQSLLDRTEKNNFWKPDTGPIKEAVSILGDLGKELKSVGYDIDPVSKMFEVMTETIKKLNYEASKAPLTLKDINAQLKEQGQHSISTTGFVDLKDKSSALDTKLSLSQSGAPAKDQQIWYEFSLATQKVLEQIAAIENIIATSNKSVSDDVTKKLSDLKAELPLLEQIRDKQLQINNLNTDSQKKLATAELEKNLVANNKRVMDSFQVIAKANDDLSAKLLDSSGDYYQADNLRFKSALLKKQEDFKQTVDAMDEMYKVANEKYQVAHMKGESSQEASDQLEMLRSAVETLKKELPGYNKLLEESGQHTLKFKEADAALKKVFQETIQPYRDIGNQANAYFTALQKGWITLDTYKRKLTELKIETANLNLEMGRGKSSDILISSLGRMVSGYKNVATSLSTAFGDFFTKFEDGFANSIGRAIVYGDNLQESLANVAKEMVSGLISALVKLGIQWVVMQVLGETLAASSVAAMAPIQTELALAWAPAAALASLATLGENAVPAGAAIETTTALAMGQALLKPYESGGYTGDLPTNSVAGLVHGQEYVFDAASTRAIGVDNLEAMRRNASAMSNGGSTRAGAKAGMQVTIQNFAGGVTHEVEQVDENHIRIIAKQEAVAAVHKHAPNVIASDLRNPNSSTSKGMNQAYKVQRNR